MKNVKRKAHLSGIVILIGVTLLLSISELIIIVLSLFPWTKDILITLGEQAGRTDYLNFIFGVGSFLSFIHYFKLIRRNNVKQIQEPAKKTQESLPFNHGDDQKEEKPGHHNDLKEGQENIQEFKKKKEKKKKQKPKLEIKDGKVVQKKEKNDKRNK